MLVGPNEAAFTVHENYICAKSRFFKAACRKEWSEGITRVIRLPEAEPEMFRSYLVWVYTDGLAVDITNSEPVQAQETKYSTFVKLYVLGDRLEDLRLRNSIMEILVNSKPPVQPRVGDVGLRAYADRVFVEEDARQLCSHAVGQGNL